MRTELLACTLASNVNNNHYSFGSELSLIAVFVEKPANSKTDPDYVPSVSVFSKTSETSKQATIQRHEQFLRRCNMNVTKGDSRNSSGCVPSDDEAEQPRNEPNDVPCNVPDVESRLDNGTDEKAVNTDDNFESREVLHVLQSRNSC